MKNECDDEAEQRSTYTAIRRLYSSENLVCKRQKLIFDTFIDFSTGRDVRMGVVSEHLT